MTEHETHPPRPTRKALERALASLDFPMDKEDVVRCVTDAGGAEEVVRQLRSLPLASYGSAEEIIRSVELADQLGR